MLASLQNALITNNARMAIEILNNNPALAESCIATYNSVSRETDPVPLLMYAYKLDNDALGQKVRHLFLEKGADINYRFPDGSTLGHSFASASVRDFEAIYQGLICWIQDGGDLSLKDEYGSHPLRLMAELSYTQKINTFATQAILLGLNKRPAFPARLIENGCFDNPDEIEEISTRNPSLFLCLQNKTPTIKSAYKLDTIAYRAFRELLLEQGLDINADIKGDLGGTLGHIFAMQAANRNDVRHYLRLIQWIREGGDVNKKDKLGLTPLDRLTVYATNPQFETSKNLEGIFPGICATVAILKNVEADKVNDPAAKTDVRNLKFDWGPKKIHGCPKGLGLPILDTKEGMEQHLRNAYKRKIIAILSEAAITFQEIQPVRNPNKRIALIKRNPQSQTRDQENFIEAALTSPQESPTVNPSPQRRRSIVEATQIREQKTFLQVNNEKLITNIEHISKEEEKINSTLHGLLEELKNKDEQLKAAEKSLALQNKEIEKLSSLKETEQNKLLQLKRQKLELEENLQKNRVIIDELGEVLKVEEKKRAQFEKEKNDLNLTIQKNQLELLKLQNDILEVEDAITCPISLMPMKDPWFTPIGHSYEKEEIFRWVRQKGSCPITRAPLTIEQLKPNFALRKVVEIFN